MKTVQRIQTNPAIGDRGYIDLYLPQGDGPHPFILGIHGGGWQRGDQSSYAHLWPRIEPAGIGFVLCSYRVSEEAKFPAAYDDLLHLLRWLTEHGRDHQLDIDHMVAFGGSAGGHLTSLLITRGLREHPELRPLFRAAVIYCPIIDLQAESHQNMVTEFLGENAAPSVYQAASPIHHIHDQMPPIWLAHGTADNVVPIEHSRRFVEAIRAVGGQFEYREAEGRKHTLVADDNAPPEAVAFLFEREMLDFVKRRI